MAKKKNSRKWIKIKRPGRIQKECKRRGYSGVTKKCIADIKKTASKRHDRSLMSAANLAVRFKWGDIAKAKKRKAKKKGRK